MVGGQGLRPMATVADKAGEEGESQARTSGHTGQESQCLLGGPRKQKGLNVRLLKNNHYDPQQVKLLLQQIKVKPQPGVASSYVTVDQAKHLIGYWKACPEALTTFDHHGYQPLHYMVQNQQVGQPIAAPSHSPNLSAPPRAPLVLAPWAVWARGAVCSSPW